MAKLSNNRISALLGISNNHGLITVLFKLENSLSFFISSEPEV